MAKRKLTAKPKPDTLSWLLRRAIADSGLSLYAVSKKSGIDYSTCHRFLSGKADLNLRTADKLFLVVVNLSKGGKSK